MATNNRSAMRKGGEEKWMVTHDEALKTVVYSFSVPVF